MAINMPWWEKDTLTPTAPPSCYKQEVDKLHISQRCLTFDWKSADSQAAAPNILPCRRFWIFILCFINNDEKNKSI